MAERRVRTSGAAGGGSGRGAAGERETEGRARGEGRNGRLKRKAGTAAIQSLAGRPRRRRIPGLSLLDPKV